MTTLMKIERDELLKPLQTVTSVVAKKGATMPILSNVLIENKGGQLSITGTDLEMEIVALGMQVEAENFRLTVNAKKLEDILKALNRNTDIALEQNQQQLTLKAGKGRYKLQMLSPDDFPVMHTESVVSCFSIKQDKLRSLLLQVQYAMAKEDIRFYLKGVLIQVQGNQLNLVSTDGHRLACTQVDIDADLPANEIIVPSKTVLELIKILSFPDEFVTVDLMDHQVRFTTKDAVIISKIMDGKYPDYKRVIPQDHKNIFQLSRTAFLEAIERVSVFADEKHNSIRLDIHPGEMIIRSISKDQETAEETIEIAYQGDTLEIGFNFRYLTDVLRTLHSEDVRMACGNSGQSVLMTVPDDEHFKYVIMPMKA